MTAVGGTSAAIVPSSSAAPVLGGAAANDALTGAATWKRQFEVGWQTGYAGITATQGIAPTAPGATTYTLSGSLAAPLPGTFFGGAGGV